MTDFQTETDQLKNELVSKEAEIVDLNRSLATKEADLKNLGERFQEQKAEILKPLETGISEQKCNGNCPSNRIN